MKKLFLQYYLPPFLIVGVILFINEIIGNRRISLDESLLYGGVMMVMAALFVGSIFYFVDTLLGASKQGQMQEKAPLIDFAAKGFVQKETHWEGEINGYWVNIGYHQRGMGGKPCISAQVFFHPQSNGRFLVLPEIEKLQAKYSEDNLIWGYNTILEEWGYHLSPPEFDPIYTKLTYNTKVLEKERFIPIDPKEMEALVPELEAYINQ